MIKREFMQLMPKLQKPPNLEFIVPETGNSGENPSNPPTTDKNNDDEDPSSSNPPTTDNERSSSSNPPTTDNNNGNKRPSSSAPPTTDNEHPPSSKPPTTENVNGPSSQQAPDDKHPSPPTLGNGTTEIIDGTLNQEGDQEGPDDSRAPSPPKAKSILRRHIRRAKRPYLSYSKALKKSGTQKGPSPSVFNKPPHLLTQSLRSANDADMALMASLSPRTKAFVLQAASGNVQRSLNEHYEQLLSLGLVSIEETRPDIQLPGRTTFRRFARHFQ
jgi:hypothetical protein